MRVVFLDIDGVLNHPGTYAEAAWRREPEEILRVPVDPGCVDCLNRITQAAHAQIVISSSWRFFARWQDLGPALARYGVRGSIVGETPDLASDAAWQSAWQGAKAWRAKLPWREQLVRGHEIEAWLEHASKVGAGVESFVILDDVSDMADLCHRWVSVNPVTGLDDRCVTQAIYALENPCWRVR